MKRQTVCVKPTGLMTNNVFWNDADHAAAIGAPAISPFKKSSPTDLAWLRYFNRSRQGLRLSGFTQHGRKVPACA